MRLFSSTLLALSNVDRELIRDTISAIPNNGDTKSASTYDAIIKIDAESAILSGCIFLAILENNCAIIVGMAIDEQKTDISGRKPVSSALRDS
jgi:hypothetical protein